MKIAFVTLPGMLVGGVPTYLYRLARGMIKIGHDVRIVAITKKSEKSLDGYIAAGMLSEEKLIIGNDVKEAINVLNSFDFIVYEQACGYTDITYAKEHDGLPWYYSIITHVKKPAVTFFHSHYTFGKHSPYIDVWESVCKAFCAARLSIAEYYVAERGVKDVYIVPLPIEISNVNFMNKRKVIVSTNRLDPVKRLDPMINAMIDLWDWRLELHSGENIWFYKDAIVRAVSGVSNIGLHMNSTVLNYAAIYNSAALVYCATKLAPEDYGGTENAVLEGVVCGAVPLLSEEWISSEGFHEDSAYKFSIYKKESNIVDIVSNIYPCSIDYCAKQTEAYRILEMIHKDTKVAKLFEKVLKNV